jgi:hypothetical protein
MSENSFTSNDVSLADISFKNKLKSHHIYFTIVNKVVDLIMKIPEYQKLKFEQETIRLICNMIENSSIPKKNSDGLKINKKDLVIECLHRVFNYTPSERDIISNMIDFLFSNNFIKKSSYYKLTKNLLKSYIKPKQAK